MKTSKVTWTCPKCGIETEVEVTPYIPAQIYGPPEGCYDAEGGEIEPTECECGEGISQEQCQEKVGDNFPDYIED